MTKTFTTWCLHKMIQTFLRSTSHDCCRRQLVHKVTERVLGHEQFQNLTRASSLFNCMGFIRRTTTNGKVEIADGARKEAELTFLHKIAIRLRNFKFHPRGYFISIKPNQSIFLSAKQKWVKRFHIRTYRRLE